MAIDLAGDDWRSGVGYAGITFLICYIGLEPSSDVYEPLRGTAIEELYCFVLANELEHLEPTETSDQPDLA